MANNNNNNNGGAQSKMDSLINMSDLEQLLKSFMENYAQSDQYTQGKVGRSGYGRQMSQGHREKGLLDELIYQSLTDKTGFESDYPYGEALQFKGQTGGYSRPASPALLSKQTPRPGNITDILDLLQMMMNQNNGVK